MSRLRRAGESAGKHDTSQCRCTLKHFAAVSDVWFAVLQPGRSSVGHAGPVPWQTRPASATLPRDLLSHEYQAPASVAHNVSGVIWLLQDYCATNWGRQLLLALKELHKEQYPAYWSELQGLAAGSSMPFDTVGCGGTVSGQLPRTL